MGKETLKVRWLVLKINSIKQTIDRCYLSITFPDKITECNFLQNIITYFGETLPVNCILTDLDTGYSAYEEYFTRGNYYVFDRLTTASIFAFELNKTEIQDVLANWGYYTIDAMFVLGIVGAELKYQKLDITNELMFMPIVIDQVLDNSLDINLDLYYFEEILKFLEKNTGGNTGDGSPC